MAREVLVPIDVDEFLNLVEERMVRASLRAQEMSTQHQKMGTRDAAKFCGYERADGTINVDAFKMWVLRHNLPRHTVGRRWVFNRADLEAAMSRRRKPAAAPAPAAPAGEE